MKKLRIINTTGNASDTQVFLGCELLECVTEVEIGKITAKEQLVTAKLTCQVEMIDIVAATCCGNCGKPFESDAMFCVRCGNRVGESQ